MFSYAPFISEKASFTRNILWRQEFANLHNSGTAYMIIRVNNEACIITMIINQNSKIINYFSTQKYILKKKKQTSHYFKTPRKQQYMYRKKVYVHLHFNKNSDRNLPLI